MADLGKDAPVQCTFESEHIQKKISVEGHIDSSEIQKGKPYIRVQFDKPGWENMRKLRHMVAVLQQENNKLRESMLSE